MSRSQAAALALATCLAGCATVVKPPPPPIPMSPAPAGERPADTEPAGELVWTDLTGVSAPRRASFDEWSINGPRLSLRRGTDGRWVGKAAGREVSLVTG